MIVTLKNNEISATINSFGAELVSLIKGETNYIWTVDTNYWNKTSPVLFPIVGRLKNDSYSYKDKEYHLNRHGFARENEFEVVLQNETEVVFSFSSNEETLKVYPFIFELQIIYTLTTTGLLIAYKVINKSVDRMPFSIGAHPAFAMTQNFEDYTLAFPKEEIFESYLLENELFSGKTKTIPSKGNTIPLSYDLFAEDALVFKHLKSSEITVLYKNEPYFKINCKGFPYLGIWTKANAPFLCLEPWFGHADEKNTTGNIEEKAGVQKIDAKATFECQFSIEVL